MNRGSKKISLPRHGTGDLQGIHRSHRAGFQNLNAQTHHLRRQVNDDGIIDFLGKTPLGLLILQAGQVFSRSRRFNADTTSGTHSTRRQSSAAWEQSS